MQTQLVTPHRVRWSPLLELDALGHTMKVRNPGYGSADTVNFTTSTYDALGRVKNILYADGSQELFACTGDVLLHTDPAQAKTQQTVDALGRIIQVVEDPLGPNTATTTYTYDALDDLTSAIRGTQTRSFG